MNDLREDGGASQADAELNELVVQIASGDDKALERLLQTTSGRVLGLATRILGERASAEEVTLDVYTQVWRQASRFDVRRGSVMTWLLMMARSRALDAMRSRAHTSRRVELGGEFNEPVDPAPDPEAESVRTAGSQRIRTALEVLPSEQRRAIEAAFFGGLSHSEIATALGEPLGTIKTRIRRGMVRLRELPRGGARNDVMSAVDHSPDQVTERAALYAAGSMPSGERTRYEQHLAACDECTGVVASFDETRRELGSMSTVEPSADFASRVLANVREQRDVQVWRRWREVGASPGSIQVQTAGDAPWEPTGVLGIDVRRLAVDRTADRVTMLIRMQAGSQYPSHRHGGVEDCYVIEGDLLAGDVEMHTGDFMRAEHGSTHRVQSTREGCVLFISSSLHDEIVADM